jgi:hypothetical protein
LKSLFNKHKAEQTYRRLKPYAVAGARLAWAELISIGMYVLDALNNLRIRAQLEPFIALAALATIIYAVFAYNQWQVMHEQLRIMSDQLNQMDIAQRPWLTLSRATPTNVIVMDSFVIIGLDLRARNIGHSPAEKASAWGKAYPSLSLTEESNTAKKVCKDAFGQTLEFLKVMILPDEDLPIEQNRFLIGTQEITQPPFSAFSIVGCITYAYRDGNAWGQTAFIIDVDRPCPESPVGKCAFDVSRPRKYGSKDVMGTEVRRGLFAR